MASSIQTSCSFSQKAFALNRTASISRHIQRRNLALKATGNKYGSSQVPLGRDPNAAADDTAKDISAKLQRTYENLQERWEENDEKPTTVALIIAAFVAIWATGGLVDAIDRLPLIGGLFELVGLGVSGWFIYRYLGTADDRQELQREFDSFLSKVGVKK